METNKGFIVPVLVGIIALLIASGGVYVYKNKKVETPTVLDTEIQEQNQVKQQTDTKTPPVNTKINNLPSQTETTNWKTYTNTKYGFELKYPQDWNLYENKDANSENVNIFSVDNIYYGSVGVALQTRTLAFITNNDSGYTYSYGNEILGGRNLTLVVGANTKKEPIQKYFETKLNSINILISSDIAENYPTFSNQEKWNKLNKILSTFKFTQ